MTNEQILSMLSPMNYACLYVKTDDHLCKFGPTEPIWRNCLDHATDEQRAVLTEKLNRWNARLSV